jgi:hypothetical protein
MSHNNVEKQKQQEPSAQIVSVRQEMTMSSPIPPPEWVERFAKVYPDSARCIFQTFEETNKNNIIFGK